MASFLYKLGRYAARHAWIVLGAWTVLLGTTAVLFLVFGGTLGNVVSIPGTATEKVTNQLKERFPADQVSGSSEQIVFTTASSTGFTVEQRKAIRELLEEVGNIAGVGSVINPFHTAEQISEERSALEEGRAQLEAAVTQADDGQTQIDQATAELDKAQAQLDAAREQAQAAGQLDLVSPQLDVQQEQINQGREQLATQQATLTEGRAEVAAQTEKLNDGAALLELGAAIDQISDSGTAALATVQFEQNPIPDAVRDAVLAALDAHPVSGVDSEAAGLLSGGAIPELFGPTEAVGIAIAAVVLLIMFGTFIGVGLPLINALLGVGVGVLGSLALSNAVEMMSITPILGVMLGLAVGIDYSLFILNRHRNQLRQGVELHESIGLANGTSGNAVVFAGATVVIALLALNVTRIPFLSIMGTVGAFCVAVAVLVAVTLTPALLGLVGKRILKKKQRTEKIRKSTKLKPLKPMHTPRSVLTLVAGMVGLLVIASPALDMRLGLADNGSASVGSESYNSYNTINDEFGAGYNSPLLVIAETPTAITEDQQIHQQVTIGTALSKFDDVSAVAPVAVSEDGKLFAFQVIPTEGPNSVSTEQLIHNLRQGNATPDQITFGVAGTASANIDISTKLADVLPVYLLVVVGLSILILIVVFRSILVPVTATLGFVLSVLAALGGATAIFQWGWLADAFRVHNPGPLLNFMPILLVGILFGLAMDYQLFLVSGMREAYVHGVPPRLAVLHGLRGSKAVVIAAATIMVAVFGGFVWADSIMVQTIGFALAFGVLIDAFIVRMLLIPAAMHLLGKSAWWIPRWLDRILPNIDVEGASLERTHKISTR
jgi:RND superfamily putative drug exporter